jgi:hypothetical protein
MRDCSSAMTKRSGQLRLLGELFEEAPAGGCLFDLLKASAGLCEMRGDAEADPVGGLSD